MPKEKNKIVESEVAEETLNEKVEPAKNKKIEVEEGLLRELIQSNKELKAEVDKLSSNAVVNTPQVRKKTKDKVFKIRKWNGKIVVGYENVGTENRPIYVYRVYDEQARKEVEYVNLLLLGEKEPVKKINYINFLRDAETISVKEVSRQEKEEIKEYGMIPKKEMAENGYGMYETMVMVPVEVTEKIYTITVQLPEEDGGETLTIDSRWLN